MAMRERGRKDTWGLAVFLISPAVIGGLICLALRMEPGHELILSRYALLTGFAFSALCFSAGRYAYSRMYNPRVYVCSHLAGLTGILYFLPSLNLLKSVPPEMFLFVSQINLVIVLLLPSKTKFRAMKLATRVLVPGELLTVWIVGLSPDLLSRGLILYNTAQTPLKWVMTVWPLFILSASYLLTKRQFHLGGTISGCSYFFTAAYLSALGKTQYSQVSPLLVAAALLYLSIGTALHAVSGMEQRASYDPVLHIFSRNYCSRIIEEQAKLNTSVPFGVAMVDIDHFKKVNDTWGHQAGDKVLIAAARAIRDGVGRLGVLCRYGGEELVIFFPKFESRELMPVMEKVRKSVEALKVPVRGKKYISVTVSCGISHRESHSQTIAEIIEAADRALYRAKKSGRNRVCAARPVYARGALYPVSKLLTDQTLR
jgi:diguanylate cyclase (GGDEF)-like protein